MIPNRTWFPLSLQERNAWYVNFAAQAVATGASLGLSLADLAQIAQDAAMMAFLATSAVALDEFNKSVTQFRDILTAGDVGDVKPSFPVIPALVPPTIPPVGIFERVALVYRPRIMASSIYTEAMGAQYGIVPAGNEPPNPDDIKPTLVTVPAETGNMFAAVVTGRGLADQSQIWAAESGTTAWHLIGTLTGKSGDVTAPNTTGKPVQLQVRVQLRKNNADYGSFSPTVQTTINP